MSPQTTLHEYTHIHVVDITIVDNLVDSSSGHSYTARRVQQLSLFFMAIPVYPWQYLYTHSSSLRPHTTHHTLHTTHYTPPHPPHTLFFTPLFSSSPPPGLFLTSANPAFTSLYASHCDRSNLVTAAPICVKLGSGS